MKPRTLNLIWGLAMVVAGGLFLAQSLGMVENLPPIVWIGFFTGLSLVFFASYFISGIRQWWWLLPALITGSLALTISLSTAGVTDSAIGAPVLAAIAIPFVVAYAVDTKQNWWALIPAWVMGVLTFITVLADRAPGELMGTIVLWGIALPFIMIYLTDRTRWWALIPGGIMTVIGIIPLLTTQLSGATMGAAVMLLFAMPFIVVYFLSPKNWWAIIPAGIFIGISIVAGLAGDQQPDLTRAGVMTGILFLIWAATFLLVWLRRGTAPTHWAIYPAGGMAAASIIAFIFGANALNNLWPIVIIAIGVIVLYQAIRKPSLQ